MPRGTFAKNYYILTVSIMSEIDEKYTVEYFRVPGQKVDEQDRGVRVTCKETGAWADCTEHKSRYKNIEQAIEQVERIKSCFKVIVAGSRGFNDYEVLRERFDCLGSLKFHAGTTV